MLVSYIHPERSPQEMKVTPETVLAIIESHSREHLFELIDPRVLPNPYYQVDREARHWLDVCEMNRSETSATYLRKLADGGVEYRINYFAIRIGFEDAC